MTYAEKLQDPRWKKLRLEILERDKWTCQECNEKSPSLQVHHKIYESHDPWDTRAQFLTSLCEECHENESKYISACSKSLLNSVKMHFSTDQIPEISIGFENMSQFSDKQTMSDCISWALMDANAMNVVLHMYYKYLEENPDC